VSDSWATKTPPPVKVSAYASAVVDNKIYIIGGSPVGNLTQIYHPETDTWSYRASISQACWGAAAGATTGVFAPKRFYVMGGYPTFNLNQIYDPETDTWTTGANMPTNRYGLGVAVVDDRLYAIGGGDIANEQYVPLEYETETDQTEPSQTVLTTIITVAVIVAAISGGFMVYFTKLKKKKT
jgi:N-acetylneuraminic acid mutarotase